MVSGCGPFARETLADATAAILNEDPPALEREGRELPTELPSLVQRCLEKEPERRFADAREVAEALAALSP